MSVASQLDSQDFLTRHDPSGMLSLTLDFADQCQRALEIVQSADLGQAPSPKNVVMTGLGGSAAGGDFVRAILDAEGSVPFIVNRDYNLPSWVDADTLVFAVSYSGNTEETLAAYEDARRRGATIVVVSSGGKLTELAKQNGNVLVSVPGGQPPRTAMGYLLVPVLFVCQQYNLVAKQGFAGAIDAVRAMRASAGPETNSSSNHAMQLAAELTGKLGVLYAMGGWSAAVAQRWRGQINENSKEMVFTHVFPELCHNEILGWEGSHEQGVSDWVTVILGDGKESERMRVRAQITFDIIGKATKFIPVNAVGNSVLAKALSLAHFGDYVSLYLAALAGRDPGNMRAIDQLKEELAKRD